MNQENYFLEKLKKNINGRIAVFIDAANLEKSVQDMWVHPRDIPEKFKGVQRIVRLKAKNPANAGLGS